MLIIGCNGGFGEVLSRRFAADDEFTVDGIDLQDASRVCGVLSRYLRADATDPNRPARSLVAEADWIILATPKAPTIASIPLLESDAHPGSLLADILSVKSQVVQTVIHSAGAWEYVSLHPLFAPQGSTFQSGAVAYVPVRNGPQCEELLATLKRWGTGVIRMSADEHDRQMAIVQVLAHAAILSFGAASGATGSAKVGTPVHAALRGLAVRVSGGDPGLYWDIQKNNPHAAAARREIAARLDALRRAVDAGDFDAFAAIYHDAGRRVFAR